MLIDQVLHPLRRLIEQVLALFRELLALQLLSLLSLEDIGLQLTDLLAELVQGGLVALESLDVPVAQRQGLPLVLDDSLQHF